MKGIVIYYSFSGSAAKFAKNLAEQNGFKLRPVTEKKKRTIFGAALKGCRQAMKRMEIEINRVKIDWTGIQKVVVACPIWAGYPAPAFNSIIKLIPKKMPIELYFISGSGSSVNSRAKTEQLLAEAGYNIVSYTDVMTRSIYSQAEVKEEKKEEITEAVEEMTDKD